MVQWLQFTGKVDKRKITYAILPKIVNIGSFLTELFKKWQGGIFWDTMYVKRVNYVKQVA